MSQVYERQAQSQAESLEAGAKESDSDSEAGPKPADSYMQEGAFLLIGPIFLFLGLERPPPKTKVRTVNDGDDSEASDEDTPDDLPCKLEGIGQSALTYLIFNFNGYARRLEQSV
jgi:hypothetical protein